MTAPVCVSKARLGSDRRGNVTITFGLMGAIMLMSVGVAIDYGRSFTARTRLQAALDAAALAALRVDAADRQSVVEAYFQQNVRDRLGDGAVPVVQTLPDGVVKVSARASIPTTVTKLMRVEAIEVEAQALADPFGSSSRSGGPLAAGEGVTPCLHIADEGAIEALHLASNTKLFADTCDVYVRSERSGALLATDNTSVRFQSIKVKGTAEERGDKITIAGPPYRIEPDADAVEDPYRGAMQSVSAAAPVGACIAERTNRTFSGGSVAPGTYCGTTAFDGVTFTGGLYVVKGDPDTGTPGRLTISGKVDGSAGVSFFLADADARLAAYTASAGSVLKAPASGISQGLLFFEAPDRGTLWPLSIAGATGQSWQGLIYLPSADVTLEALSSWPQMNISMAVNTLRMLSVSNVLAPYAWQPFDASAAIAYNWTSTSVIIGQAQILPAIGAR